MNEKYTYIGAFLILKNITEECNIRELACPTHGGMSTDFCPKCGAKVIEQHRKGKITKRTDDDNKWIDKMFACKINPRDDQIILIPNKADSGQLIVIDKYDFISIDEPDPQYYMGVLEDFYKDYIEWLKDEQKFDITVKFGAVNYWN